MIRLLLLSGRTLPPLGAVFATGRSGGGSNFLFLVLVVPIVVIRIDGELFDIVPLDHAERAARCWVYKEEPPPVGGVAGDLGGRVGRSPEQRAVNVDPAVSHRLKTQTQRGRAAERRRIGRRATVPLEKEREDVRVKQDG